MRSESSVTAVLLVRRRRWANFSCYGKLYLRFHDETKERSPAKTTNNQNKSIEYSSLEHANMEGARTGWPCESADARSALFVVAARCPDDPPRPDGIK